MGTWPALWTCTSDQSTTCAYCCDAGHCGGLAV